MIPFGIGSTLLILIVALGARKVWKSLVWLLSRPFKHPSETRVAHIKRAAFIVVAITVVAVPLPYNIPFNGAIRTGIWLLYLLYAGLGLFQIYDFFVGKPDPEK